MGGEGIVNVLHQIDCMEYMATVPDNHFDLAVVDPPYGIDVNMNCGKRKHEKQKYQYKRWDNKAPDKKYFEELFRISQNQIIWGANNFTSFIPNSTGWIFWDKDISGDVDFSHGELAYTSYSKSLKKIVIRIQSLKEPRIHPTQKPIALYKWLLINYAKPGFKLLDTNSGSGSFRIAAYDLGFDLDSCENDADYCRDNEAQFQNHIKQNDLFTPQEIQKNIYSQGEL